MNALLAAVLTIQLGAIMWCWALDTWELYHA